MSILLNNVKDKKLIYTVEDEHKALKIIPKLLRSDVKVEFISNKPLFKTIEKIINTTNIKQRYDLIYDYICDYADNELASHDYCHFVNDQCVAQQHGKAVHYINGCCYQRHVGQCKYLENRRCLVKNISCKLFMCSYLRSKGIKFNVNKIPGIKYFLNNKQKRIIRLNYFKPKEEVIQKILEAVK